MKMMTHCLAAFFAIALVTQSFAQSATSKLPSQTDLSLLKEAETSVAKATKYLLSHQKEEDGSWSDNPAITGLVITALLQSPTVLTPAQRAQVDRGVQYILKFVNSDGSIGKRPYLNYTTSICGMALLFTGKQEYNDIVRKAREYIQKSQISEVQGYRPDYPGYGGIGYGSRPEQKDRPDLSNTGFALEFLALTEGFDTESDPRTPETRKLHWKRALVFLQRCQNLPMVDGIGNDLPWQRDESEDYGGAIYAPTETRGRVEKVKNDKGEEIELYVPYGSITYVLLKSYIFCELTRDDIRVRAAFDWLSRHFTVEENPGIGQEGIYYYFMSMAKALAVFQADWIKLPDGKMVDWRYELMKRLINLQKGDGCWVNEKGRWQESDPMLTTSYALLAMNVCLNKKYP